MKVNYLASSPEGDFRLETEDLTVPFRTRPDQTHPTLTLGDYLNGLRAFVLQQGTRSLCQALSDHLSSRVTPGDLREIHIRTEKHGALYHVASVEPITHAGRSKLALSTAVSPRARVCLAREEEHLADLARRFGLPYLPAPLLSGDALLGACGTGQPVRMLLAEWFKAFHEWHLNRDAEGGPPQVHLWDSIRGYRFATEAESRTLFHEIARILTLYYDTTRFCQILSWHHAAGDFVVCTAQAPLQVRLTTVRDYQPLPGLAPEAGIQPLVALVYFFLNLLVRMRVDRHEGVGELLWAGERAVRAAVAGFFDALEEMHKAGRWLPAEATEIRDLLLSFSPAELLRLHYAVLDLDPNEDSAERAWIAGRLEEHAATVHRTLQAS